MMMPAPSVALLLLKTASKLLLKQTLQRAGSVVPCNDNVTSKGV